MTRLRFSIRDLFWLTALVAVLVAWWIEHRRHQNTAATQQIWKERAQMLRSMLYPNVVPHDPTELKGIIDKWDTEEVK